MNSRMVLLLFILALAWIAVAVSGCTKQQLDRYYECKIVGAECIHVTIDPQLPATGLGATLQ